MSLGMIVLIVLVLGGLGAWSVLASDSYSSSGHGCVNVTVPSSTGGATLHYCGAAARSFCQTSFRKQDQISLRARPALRPRDRRSHVDDDGDGAVVDQ